MLQPPQIDVLWVISGAATMEEEQLALVEELERFIYALQFSGADWRVGVTSTDVQDDVPVGALQQVDGVRYITADTSDPEERLGKLLLSVGTSETAVEGAFEAVQTLVSEDDDFYRHGASLHVLLVSDRDEGTDEPEVVDDFLAWAHSLKPLGRVVTWSSVVGDAPLGCEGRLGAAEAGARYLDVSEELGGIAASICRDRWDLTMSELGFHAQRAPHEYQLSEPPIEGTIEAWLEVPNGDPKDMDFFVYDGVDEAWLEDGSELVDHCPSRTCFVYAIDPVRNSMVVKNYVPPIHSIMHIEYGIAGKQRDVIRGQ